MIDRCANGIGGGTNCARGEGDDAPDAGAGAGDEGDGSSSEMVYMLMVPAMIEDSPVNVRRGRDHCLRPVESWG